MRSWRFIRVLCIAGLSLTSGSFLVNAQDGLSLPTLDLPNKKIAEVYHGNWHNTLKPCLENLIPADESSPHADANRPWKVDVGGHYPGWYPGVDVKHSTAAYLACGKDLSVVLKAWQLTSTEYMMQDGGIKPSTMKNNPQGIWPETTIDGTVVYYPLQIVATIDYLLTGHIIYRFSQDKQWLKENLPRMRKAASYLAGWIDDEGLLLSYSYDLDQVYREIDGVAMTSAALAFRQLAQLEGVLENRTEQQNAQAIESRLTKAFEKHFWDQKSGYYYEHLAYNNIAKASKLGKIVAFSSELDNQHPATKAIDGITGIGIDAFGVGIGAGGKHEWAAKNETAGAWIQIGFSKPTKISKVILTNRTDINLLPGEKFRKGVLEFSDGSPKVEVVFNSLMISRAVACFEPRSVEWIKFSGTEMQGETGAHAGLSEFMVLPDAKPYRKISHGMTDTNFAAVALGIANPARVKSIWNYFKAHEQAFYEVNGLNAPTWISEKAETYGKSDLNRRAPYKDCVAMARIWRYDALMRRRMGDGEGIARTINDANILYDRPSGGGSGLFAERYALGKFQPGDEAQATIPAYAGYPAIYNSTIIQEALLGISTDVSGTIIINPCVPASWYQAGFAQQGCGILKNRDLGFSYSSDRLAGWVSGMAGEQSLSVRLPPERSSDRITILVDGQKSEYSREAELVKFNLELTGGKEVKFSIR